MNDFLEMIRSRASIRAFTDEPLSEEMIHALEEAALGAPNGGNAQPWHFIFCTDQERILELEGELVAGIRASGNEKIIQLQASRNWRMKSSPGIWMPPTPWMPSMMTAQTSPFWSSAFTASMSFRGK